MKKQITLAAIADACGGHKLIPQTDKNTAPAFWGVGMVNKRKEGSNHGAVNSGNRRRD